MDGSASAKGRDGLPELVGGRGLADSKHNGVLRRLAAVRSQMDTGISAGDHRNGGARRLTTAALYRAVGGEEEGSFEPRTHPVARGRVEEGAEGQTATPQVEIATVDGGEEVDGRLDFRHPRPIPSARMVGTTRRDGGVLTRARDAEKRRLGDGLERRRAGCVRHEDDSVPFQGTPWYFLVN